MYLHAYVALSRGELVPIAHNHEATRFTLTVGHEALCQKLGRVQDFGGGEEHCMHDVPARLCL